MNWIKKNWHKVDIIQKNCEKFTNSVILVRNIEIYCNFGSVSEEEKEIWLQS